MIYRDVFMSPDVCVRRRLETDIPERHGYVTHWSLKEIILLILLHLMCLFALHYMYDLNQLQCKIHHLRRNGNACAADIE